jgi:hypothetical protein
MGRLASVSFVDDGDSVAPSDGYGKRAVAAERQNTIYA